MTRSRSVTKPVAVLVSVMMLAATLALGPAAAAGATGVTEGQATPANVPPDEIGRENRLVETALKCYGDGGAQFGPLPIDFDVPIQVESPTSVQPGKTFDVVIAAEAVEVPNNFDGLPITINNFTNIQLRAFVGGPFEIVSLTADQNSGFFQPNGISNPNAPKQFINPTPSQLFFNAPTSEVRLVLPGPYTGNSVVKPPNIRARVRAIGENGDLITSQLGGVIPQAQTVFPWPSFSFTVTVSASVAIININAPAYCAPNYGRFTDIPGNDVLPIPFLSRTVIDDRGPDLIFRTPRAGFVYDIFNPETNPDSRPLIADFACTDPSGVVSCVMTDGDGNEVVPGQRLPDTFNNDGELTLRAVDGFGFTSERTIEYSVSSNTPPFVDAGDDVFAGTLKRVELVGSATDVDFGQILAYRWIQVAGPPVTLAPTDDPFDPKVSFITPPGPEELIFALRVDDGQDYAEAFVSVFVDPNNAPQVINKQFQYLGFCPADVLDDDERCDDTPIPTRSTVTMDVTATDLENDELGIPLTYEWRQVDENGNDLSPGNPEQVTLSSTTDPVVTFAAPQLSRELTLYFEAVVSDGDPRADVTAEVTVRIRRNLPPVFSNLNDGEIIAGIANGNPVRMVALATDPEGRPVTYAWRQVDASGVELPEGDPLLVDLDVNGGIADFLSRQTVDPYTLYFRVVASDGLDLGDTEYAIEVRVLGNLPPLFNNLSTPVPGGATFNDFNVLNRQSVEVDASGVDPEDRPLTYAWRQVDASRVDLAESDPNRIELEDPSNPVQTFVGPDTSDEVTYYFAVVMSDGVANGNVEAFVRVVFGPNLPPVLEGGYEQSVTDIETRGLITLDGTATDPEGGDVFYAWSQVDADGAPIGESDPTSVTLTGTDQPIISFTAPDTSDAVTLYLKLTVSDGLVGGSADALFTVSVRANNVPVITAPALQFGISGLPFSFNGSATDLDITNGDNQQLRWSWVQVTDATGATPVSPSDPTFLELSDPAIESPEVVPDISNEEIVRFFRVTVSDGFDSVTLVITATFSANNAPFADAGEDQIVPRGTVVTLDGSGDDPDGHSIGAYLWTQVDAAGVALDPTADEFVSLSSREVPAPTFTAPNLGTADVVLYFQLLVFDEFGQVSKDPDTVTITVRNQAPVVNAGPDQSGRAANSLVTLSGTATDADLPVVLSFLWEQVDADGNLVADPGTGDLTDLFLEITNPTSLTPTFIAPQSSRSRTFYLRLTATDDGGLTGTDVVAIQVNPVTLAAPNVIPDTSGTVGSFIQLAMPRPGAPGNPSDNFTYEWFQTDSAGSTEACAPTCIGGTAVIHTDGTFGDFTAEPRRPVIEVPARADRNPANSFFRVRVQDTFGPGENPLDGGNLFGASVTITTTNTAPTVNWSIRGYGSEPTARLWTGSTPNNPVWAAGPANSDFEGTIILDATENPAVAAFTEDLDGDTITYTWRQYNNPYSWGTTYRNKTDVVAVETTNFSIPSGSRNCADINLGGVNNLANGARVLLAGQSNAAQNGVWVVPNRSGSGLFGCRNNGGTWQRATDLNTAAGLEYARVRITSGTGAGQFWVLPLFANQITVNTTALPWQNETVAGPAGGDEAIYFELAGTGRNAGIDTPRLRATQSGAEVNTLTNTSGVAYLRTPVNQQFPLELSVTDGIATQTFRMVVRTTQTANTAPVATRTSPAVTTIRGGVSASFDPVTLAATIDDAQARPGSTWPVNGGSANENLGPQSLSYQWIQTDSAGVELATDDPDRVTLDDPEVTVVGQVASATAVQTSFTPPPETKTLYFRVRVSDGIKTSLSDVQTVVLQINRIVPVADAGEAQDGVRADQVVTLDGSASFDEDGFIETYLWEQVDADGALVTDGPTKVTLSDASAVKPTFAAPSLTASTDLFFRLTVTDDFGDIGRETVRVGVLRDAEPTAVATFSPDPVVLGQTVTLSGVGSSDPEGQTLTFSWVQVDDEGEVLAIDDIDYVELTGANTVEATFLPPARTFASTLYFRLTVADGAATPQTDAATVTIAVRANNAPTAVASASPETVDAGGTVTLSSTGSSDPDGDELSFLWEQVDEAGDVLESGPTLVQLSSATAAAPTFKAPGLAGPSTLRFRVTASDAFGLSGTSSVIEVAVRANLAPVVEPSASPDPANPGDTVTLDAGATDPEGIAALTYLWTQTGPAGAPLGDEDPVVTLSSLDEATPTFTAPGRLEAYTLHFSVTATDEFGVATTASVAVAVNANRAPTVTGSASPDPAPAGATVTLSATGVDPDGDDISYAWVQVDENDEPMTGEDLVDLSGANTATATFAAPDRLTQTTLRFRVTVADPYGATGTATVLSVITENRPPVITGSATPVDPRAGATVTLSGTAVDPEGRDMTYAWTQVDASGDPVDGGVTITDADTLAATFEAPGFENPTDLFFRLSVTDDTGVPVSTTVTVNVRANEAPVARITGSAAIVPPGGTLTVNGTTSSDPEGDPIAGYQWTQSSGPAVTIDDPTAATTSVVTPVTAGGLVMLQLVVTDRWGKQSTAATLTVALQPNNAPIADAGANQSDVPPGKTVTLNGSASMDAEGHTITYAWTQLSGPTVTLDDATAKMPTFVPVDAGEYLFQLIVTDQFGAVSNPAFVLVTVNPNRNPVVDAGADQADVVAATLATISGTVSDPDVEDGANQTVTSGWTQVAGDAVDLIDGDAPLTKTFRVPSTDRDQTLTFRLSADDGSFGGSAFDEVSIFVKANRVPTIDAGADQSDVVASTLATISGTVSDADILAGAAQTLTSGWTQVAGDSVVLVDGADPLTKSFRVPATASDQTLTFRLTSNDGTGEAFDEVNIFVKANRVPVVNGGEDRTGVIGGTQVTLQGSASDADIAAGADQTLLTGWVQVDPVTGEPLDDAVALFAATEGNEVSFTVPSSATAQVFAFLYGASDGIGEEFVFDEVRVFVNANRVPVVDPGDNQSGIAANQLVTLSGSATDADIDDGSNQTLGGYTWTQVSGAPVTLTPNVDGTSAVFNAPSSPSAQDLVFRLSASDGVGVGTADVTVSVNANRAPTADAGADLTGVEANDPVTLTGVGTDEDPQDLTYLWEQTAGDPVDGLTDVTQPTISFRTPIANTPQTLTFRLSVSDGTATTTDTVSVGVKANRAPVADAGPSLNEVGSETTVALDGSGSTDPEGQSLTYSWSQTAGVAVTLTGADTATPSFTAPLTAVGASLRFTLTVTDPQGLTAQDSVAVTVVPNRPPVAVIGADQTVPRQRTVTLDGSASFDPDNQTITYAWAQVTGVGSMTLVSADDPYFVTLSDPMAAMPTFLSPPPRNDGDQLFFMLVVVDSTGRVSPSVWTTITLKLNTPPTATGINQEGIGHNEVVTLGVDVVDPDGEEEFTYLWTQIDAAGNLVAPTPSNRDIGVELSDPTAESPSFVAPYLPEDTLLRFRVVVTDLEGATATATLTIEVLTNRAPEVTMAPDLTGQAANSSVTISGSASDPEGDDLTFEWAQINEAGEVISPDDEEPLPTAVVLSTTEGTSTSFVTPIVNSESTLRFRLRVTDSEGAVTDGIITVGVNANRAPVPVFDSSVYVAKTPVRVVVTTNVNVGAGPRGCGDINLGGVNNLANGDRVLLVGQTNPSQNGIWLVPNRSGTGFFGGCSNNGGTWQRSGDANSAAGLEIMRVLVNQGTGAGQTWVLPLTATQITLGTTALNYVRIENVGIQALPIVPTSVGVPTVNQTITLSYPAVVDGTDSDPEGTPSSLFTYRIARVADASSTTPCVDATCGGAGLAVNLTEVEGSDGRQATFVMPPVTSLAPLTFRMFIDDGFGAVYASPVLSVIPVNTPPSLVNNNAVFNSRAGIRVVAGADVRIDDAGSVLGGLERTVMGGPGTSPLTPGNVPNDGRPGSAGNFFPQSTYVYGGVRTLLDGRALAAAADPDGNATVRFVAGLPPVASGLTIIPFGINTNNPNGVCQAGFTLQPTAVPSVWSFTPPTGVTENAGFCRLQVVVNDGFAPATANGVPTACLTSGDQGLVSLGSTLGLFDASDLPACQSPNAFFHAGDRQQNANSRVQNVSINLAADFWLQVFQNQAQPLAQAKELPTRVFASAPNQDPAVVTLDGSDTIDADGTDGVRPFQPLLYKWTALDPGTLEELPDDDDANQRIVDRGSVVTQFLLPEGGPEVYRFRLDVFDGNLRDIIDTGRVRVTVRRPSVDGTAQLPGEDPEGTPAEGGYPTGIPNVELGEVEPGDSVALSALGSASPDGRNLKYQWKIIAGGTNAEIEDPRSLNATLVVGEPNLTGDAESEPLVLELAVRDGYSAAYKTFTFSNIGAQAPTVYCPDPTANDPYPFTDVPANASYRTATVCLLDKGVLSPNTRFNPNNSFTRAQMILVLHRLAGKPGPFPRANFTDVPNTGEVRDALNWANSPSVGLVSNQANRLFRPNDPMRRLEFALFLHRYIGTPAPLNPGPPVTITDLPSGANPRAAITFLAQRGVFADSGRFLPENATARSFMADTVWKYGTILEPPLWLIDPALWQDRVTGVGPNTPGGGAGGGDVAVEVSCPTAGSLETYPFGDVPANASYRSATACLVENGVLARNSVFNPTGAFTRSQMLLVLHRLAGTPGGFPEAPFSDVPASGELRNAVNWGFAQGLVSSQADGRFRPSDQMRRVELALFLWRFLGKPQAGDAPAVTIPDLPASGEGRTAVTYLAQRGVVDPAATFSPNAATLRAYMAEVVYRFGQVREPALW